MYGYVVHPGGYRMAAAEMLREWAAEMGDTEQVKQIGRPAGGGEGSHAEVSLEGGPLSGL